MEGEQQQQQQQQEKRRRRPSVRLGELGYPDASSLWAEAPRVRRKAAVADVLGTGKPSPGAKAPRIRPLEQLGGQEDWATMSKAKRVYRKKPAEEEKPSSTSSGSEELQEEEADAPDVVKLDGDEIQGAIEDGPKVFSSRGKQKLAERRSGRQAAIKAVRDIAAPAPAAMVTATIVTPNSGPRGALSGGVSGWLHELGLEKYLELFELNEVDSEVLPHLTFDDLREMGVDAVGARRKMFSAIQDLGQI